MKEENFKAAIRTTVHLSPNPQPALTKLNPERLMTRAPADPTGRVTPAMRTSASWVSLEALLLWNPPAPPALRKESPDSGKFQLETLGLSHSLASALFLCFGQRTYEARPGSSGPVPVTQGRSPHHPRPAEQSTVSETIYWAGAPVVSLPSCMAMAKFYNLSEGQFPHL